MHTGHADAQRLDRIFCSLCCNALTRSSGCRRLLHPIVQQHMHKQQGPLKAVDALPKCIAGEQQLTLSASRRAGWPVQKLAGLMSPCRTPLLCLQCMSTRGGCCIGRLSPVRAFMLVSRLSAQQVQQAHR